MLWPERKHCIERRLASVPAEKEVGILWRWIQIVLNKDAISLAELSGAIDVLENPV